MIEEIRIKPLRSDFFHVDIYPKQEGPIEDMTLIVDEETREIRRACPLED